MVGSSAESHSRADDVGSRLPRSRRRYYTTRHMTNAVRKVTNDKTDPRETLLDYARTINEEINKKRLEFGLPIDEETP